MTTIAYDGEYLVADGRVNAGGLIISEVVNKLHKLNGTWNGEQMLYAASAGSFEGSDMVVEWLLTGDGEMPKDTDSTILLFTDKSIYEYNGKKFCKLVDEPMSVGSGMGFALAAMKLGKTAKEGVQLAAKMDVYTGGKIRSVRVREPKKSKE